MVFFLSKSNDLSDLISVEEMIGRLPECERFRGRDRYAYIADLMAKTTGEVQYIEDHIKKLFDTRADYQISDGYADASLLLGGTKDYALRLVKWHPISMITLPDIQRVGLAYDFLHNHDFNLVTKGILGDGYETDVYRCDPKMIAGAVGEKVDLRYQGRFKLSSGTVMWYEKFFDVHDQFPPKSPSLSFNVIPVEPETEYAQFAFDLEKGEISSFTRNRQARILSLLTLLTDFSLDESVREIAIDAAQNVGNYWLKAAIAALISEKWGDEFQALLDEFGVGKFPANFSQFSTDRFSVSHVS